MEHIGKVQATKFRTGFHKIIGHKIQSGKSGTIRESKQDLGALRVILYTKKLHFVSQNWRTENYFCSMCVQPY